MAYNFWEEVIEAIKADNEGSSFLIHLNKSEEEMFRSPFMSKTEALAYCYYKLGRQRLGVWRNKQQLNRISERACCPIRCRRVPKGQLSNE